ncbi:MAG: aminotransferase class I/II-fold pyridoxal phosphate-dependent enzyme [Geminicoccaceae bacterium]|nr:aminotransferase class I/II-fold pyridoxal phosphate-dependent enzyme [Geminicoccaceae bacterium]
MSLPEGVKPATILAQAAGALDESTGGVVPPLQPSTTFLRDPDNRYRRGFDYGRDANPGVRPLEAVVAALEGGRSALAFASGMAAMTAVFRALPPGSHVVAPRVMYWGLRKWLRDVADRGLLTVDFVDIDDLDRVRAALAPGRTRILWAETPANPTWVVADLAGLAELAHAAGARLVVDNTVPTPLLTRPFALGADLVVHSATKYLNGHSDLLGGIVVTKTEDELWTELRRIRHDEGAILGAFEAWLCLRGLRTLEVRLARQCASAMRLAAALAGHPKIERVLYPGLPAHPGHRVAARQMTGGFGGMLSILVRGGAEAAIAAAAAVRIWKRATSLGGVESLIEHRASIEGPDSPAPPGLLRLSVGLEDPDDLLADLERSLA